MTYHEITLTCESPEQAQQIGAFGELLGAHSVTMQSANEQEIFEPELDTTPLWQQTNVTLLFTEEAVSDQAANFFADHYPKSTITRQQITEQDWQKKMLLDFPPLQCGKRLWICPSWHDAPAEADVVVQIDPGLAFGTGTHPTTQLCLQWLDNMDVTDKVVIDYGCGSGILAIAAIMLGAKFAYAVDIDPQALEATVRNAQNNDVANKIQTFLPDDFADVKADIIVSNILAKPLMALAPTFADLLKPDGCLALSGVLDEQAEMVTGAYQDYFNNIKKTTLENWCRLDAIK
jgi:ribosomal protein L11 methyltransferase